MNFPRIKYPSTLALARAFLSSVLLIVFWSFFTVPAYAASVSVDDQAHVLQVDQVQMAASRLSAIVDIYTVPSFDGDAGILAHSAREHLYTTDSAMIVVMIDVAHRHIAIVGNKDASYSDQQYQDAYQAFGNTFRQKGGTYTSATLALLESLKEADDANTTSTLITWVVILVIIIALCIVSASSGGNSGSGGSRSYYFFNSGSGSSGGNGGGGAAGSF